MRINYETLPASWSCMTVGETCEILAGYGFPVSLQGRTEGDVPFYKVGDISEAWKEGSVHLTKSNNYVSQQDVTSLRAKVFPASTTVFAKIGAAIALNRRAMLSVPALVDNNVMGLHPNSPALDPSFLYYFTLTLRLAEISQATTVPSIRKGDVDRIELPLAPRNEQKRIVAEIEKQFTRLDAAVAALKRLQANLKRYRASVLKAACEGCLVPTEAELARREGRSYEPASVLLDRIRSEPQPAHAPVEELPALPEGWTWIPLGFILRSIEAGKSFKCEERPPEPGQIGVVKVSAVTWGEFDEQESKTCLESSRVNENYLIREGDFLFSRANTIELVGACVMVKKITKQLMLSDKILRFNLTALPKEWILYCLRTELGRAEIERLSTGNQESMRNIGQARIRSIRIPLPPLEEIERILAELASRFSIMNKIDVEVASDLSRADRLRQSILKRAFEGKLVAQDPNDEPASALLERIRGIAIPGCAPRGKVSKRNHRISADKEPVNA